MAVTVMQIPDPGKQHGDLAGGERREQSSLAAGGASNTREERSRLPRLDHTMVWLIHMVRSQAWFS